MSYSIATPTASASTLDSLPAELGRQILALVHAIADLATAFGRRPPTPVTTNQFENDVAERLQALGRSVVEWTYNHVEPADPRAAPPTILWQGDAYRRKPKSRNRALNCRFGPIC